MFCQCITVNQLKGGLFFGLSWQGWSDETARSACPLGGTPLHLPRQSDRESGVNILHTWFDFEKIFWLKNALNVNSSFLTNIEPCQESQRIAKSRSSNSAHWDRRGWLTRWPGASPGSWSGWGAGRSGHWQRTLLYLPGQQTPRGSCLSPWRRPQPGVNTQHRMKEKSSRF